MKVEQIFIISIILASLLLTSISLHGQQEVEPNNSLQQSNTIYVDSIFKGTLSAQDPFDWFRIDLDTSGTLQLEISKTGEGGFYIETRDGIYTSWVVDLGTVNAADSLITWSGRITQGTYYIRFQHINGTDTCAYEIIPRIILPVFPEDMEPNSTTALGDTLEVGQLSSGLVGYWLNGYGLDRDDYFVLDIEEEGALTVNVSMLGEGQLELTLIDSLRGQLGFIRRSVTTQSAFLETKVLPGIHYIKIRSYLSSHFVNYQFTTSFMTAPKANFSHTQAGHEVTFSNLSQRGQTYKWQFGDGEESESHSPFHIFENPGEYVTCLITRSTAGRDTFCQYITVGGIASVFPESAGNSGDVTLQINGGGLDTSATVSLIQDGTTIHTQDTVGLIQVDAIGARFNLRGASPGIFDVRVDNSDGSSFTYEDAFTIVEGTFPLAWAEVSGRNRIRKNITSTYKIKYGNNGNVDASMVPVYIAVSDFPDLEVEFVGARFIEYDSLSLVENLEETYITVDTVLGEHFSARLYPVIIPVIPANSNNEFDIRIRTSRDVKVKVWVNTPLYQSPLNPAVSDCLVDLAEKVMGQINVFATNAQRECMREEYRKELNAAYAKLETVTFVSNLGNMFLSSEPVKPQDPLDLVRGKLKFELNSKNLVSIVKFVKKVVTKCGGLDLNNTEFVTNQITKTIINLMLLPQEEIENCLKKSCPESDNNGFRNVNADCPECGTFCPLNIKEKTITAVNSLDPNEKEAPSGYAGENYIYLQKTIPYTIHFENVDTATAPAQIVRIVDTLDLNVFDINSFRFGSVTIADSTAFPQSSDASFSLDFPIESRNILTRIQGKINFATGIVEWEFVSLDPSTTGEIDDPNGGFLPPNKNKPEGQGSVSFSINLKSTVGHNDAVLNKALIYFDNNEPIITNQSKITIDTEPPSSMVSDISEELDTSAFEVHWGGEDTEAGIRHYDVFVAENGGEYIRWKSRTPLVSDLFHGISGSKYTFYSIAIDSVGNTESKPALPDAHTTISTGIKNSLLEKFLMHPNPNPGLINIYNHRSSPVRFKLLDISGMTIFEKLIVSGNNVVHLNPYKAGMYMSIIENGDGQIIGSEKIVLIK